MFFSPRRTWLPTALAAALLAAPAALAAPTEGVRDEAKLFTPETVKKADSIIGAIKRDHKKNLFIETLPGIPDDRRAAYREAEGDKKKHAEFFVQWARERARKADVSGVYVLITREPGHVQVEVGDEAKEKAFTRQQADRLAEIMLGAFRKKDWDKGLLDGVEYVRKAMDDNSKAEAATRGVRDEAKFFKPETVKEADRVIDAIHRDHGKDLLIETLPGIPEDKMAAYEKAKDNKAERDRFLANWARERARAAKVNGVYVLITRQPGHVQVEVGDRTREKAFTVENRDRLLEVMLAPFKEKDFDKGLRDGVEYVRKAMDDNLKKSDKPGAAPPRDGGR